MNDKPQVKVGAQTLALVANMAATIYAATVTIDIPQIPADNNNLITGSVSAAFELLKEVSRQEESFNEWLANKP